MKKIKPVVVLIVCFIISHSTRAQYTLTDADVVVTDGVITDYTGSETNIVIPNILDGQEITSIGENAFSGKSLTTVDLSGLTNLMIIEETAFFFNQLTHIDLSGLTNLMVIGNYAFSVNELITVNFSGLINLTTIGNGAFDRNSLESIDFSDLTNLKTIGFRAFYENALTTVDFSGLVSLTTIGSQAFRESALTTVNLSGLINLMTIGSFAFYENAITTLNVTGLTNLVTIDNFAFYNNVLTTIDLSGLTSLTTIGNFAFDSNTITHVDFTGLVNLETIGDRAFRENSLTTVNFSGLINLTTIGQEAFRNNSIETVDFSGLVNLRTIGGYAFVENSLTTVDFTGLVNLTTFGDLAFASNSLTHIDLSELTNLSTIGGYAFSLNLLTSFALPIAEGYVYEWKSATSEVFSNGDTVHDLETDYQAVLQSISTYDITYTVDGGEHENPNTYTIEDAVTFTTATKTGYNFEGWFAEKDFTTEITEVTAGTTGNLALFAKFTLLDYAITYHSVGGLHDNTTTTFTVEDALTIRAATKAGYIFEGWFTDENFTTEITEITAGTAGDLVLFAKYSEIVLGLIERDALVLYPNPVTHSFSINQPIDQVNVLNLGGQVVHTFCENQIRFDVSHLASGHYIVRLIKAGKSLGLKRIFIASSVR